MIIEGECRIVEDVAEEQQKLLNIFETQYILLRPYVAPPNIPKEKAFELREAFSKAVLDPEYKEEAIKLGVCELTKLPFDLSSTDKTQYNPYSPSIDRIDSSKPYAIDNIQFLSATMNYLKADMDDIDVNEFIKIVKNI